MAASGPDSRARLDALIDDFRRVVRGPTRVARLLAAWLCGSLLLLVARGGTDAWRGLAAVGLSVLPILWIGLGLRSRRRWRGSSGVRRLLTPVDAALGARVLRARGLLERTRQDETAGSAELAELHASRTVDEIPTKLLDARAQSVRRKLRWLSLALATTLGALSSAGGLRLLEGASVLFAEAGVGRLRLAYFEEVEFIVEEPAYLASGEPRLVTGTAVVLPQGSSVTARIMPRSFVRDWVLDDGLSHAAFVSEGSGTWVAHLRIDQPTTLRVGARLGEVSVFASDELQVLTLEDRAPIVKLEDAPQTLSLEDMERLELSYAAFDDHGLAQIDLVLESGRRAERIELVHLDGKRRAQQGGYALERHHPFLKRAFLPVRLRIEARDADGIDGPNWGKSAVITLTPEPIGAERARRYEALQRYRSDLVATLVAELRSNHLSRERALSARGEARAALAKSLDALRERLAETEGAARSLQFLEGQAELLAAPRSDQSTLEASVLATDALLRQLARKDAEATAVDLSGALEEIELAARALLEAPERAGAREGLQDQLTMAAEGARRLSRLGSLGADLGELALGDLARLDAVVAERSYERAARVAAHLAARLRHKRPSFGSSGSSSSGGTETGSASGDSSAGSSEGSSAEPSTAPSEFSELGKQLDELAREHASGLDALERLLNEARRAATDDTSADQRSEAAEALRHALRNLPSVGEGPGTASSEAALGRGHGEAAAAALEGGDRERVLLRAKEADAALERAERAAEAGAWDVRGDDVRQARRALKDAIAAAERGASPSSRGSNPADSGRAAQRERDLAERAERLAQRGRSGEAPLPSESTEALRRAARAMRQAAEALEAGESERGLRTAERAQRELEDAFGEPSESKQGGEGSDGRELASEEVGVPTERKDAGRSFRERVQRGLSRESGALAPAVARYAEELQ